MYNWCFVTECENNNFIGTGHIKRMITFANFVKRLGDKVHFTINNNIYAKKLLEVNNFNYCVNDKLVPNNYFDIIFLDTYNKYKNSSYWNFLFQFCDKLLVITDSHLVENIHATLIVHTNESLNGRILKNNTLVGAKYLIRESFFKCKKKFSLKVKNVLITFGGADPYDVTNLVVKSILKSKIDINDIKINILIGNLYKNKKKLDHLIKNSQFKVFQNVDNILQFYKQHDYAVTAGGNTFYELSSLGIPCSVISQNIRQHYALSALKDVISVDYMGIYKTLSSKSISDKLLNSIDNKKKRLKNYNLCQKYFKDNPNKLIYKKITW